MDYSIIIPVFNKAGLTRRLLETIRPTLEGAGEGEIIVIDNASSDETPDMLREFPWVRVVRNESNRGFSGANNQAAQLAAGKFLVLLNNDMETHRGWLASMLDIARDPKVGAVGARLLFPNGTLQHAGVAIDPVFVGTPAFIAFHDMAGYPGNVPRAASVHDVQSVTGACMLTPRSLYAELGGLDEGFWNGYEDVDYCFKVRERGLRVVYAGSAVVTHFESQSGSQRFRKLSSNVERLAQRWNGTVRPDAQIHALARGQVRRHVRTGNAHLIENLAVPQTRIICHGDAGAAPRGELERALRDNAAPVAAVDFVAGEDAVRFARDAMELRGDRYLAFVDARCDLSPGWLDELICQVEFSPNTGAATYAPELLAADNCAVVTADARCTLVALRKYPAHLRLADAPTMGSAVSEFLTQGILCGSGVRVSSRNLAELPQLEESLTAVQSLDPLAIEAVLRSRPRRRAGLVSIVMLSWNALEYTKMALESIRQYTAGEYEIVIVDNGSQADTVAWLRAQPDIRVIFNPANRGYAGGNNQAIAACRGEYIVLLNNDVIVTEGWLDGLLDAFDRIPGLGISAPVSNNVAGHQQTVDSEYADTQQMQIYAARRRERHRGEGYVTDRAIGLCLCIDRRVVDEVGGIDEGFGVGNFEDDDYCIRVRAAGYKIFVCSDVFIHHFGSKTFAANKIDWTSSMERNWARFAKKWGYRETLTDGSYKPAFAIARGFDRERHYVPLPAAASPASADGNCTLAFTMEVRNEDDWNRAGAFVRRYLQAFGADDATMLFVRPGAEMPADALRARVAKAIERAARAAKKAAAITVDSAENVDAALVVAVDSLESQSPSALRRMLALLVSR